MATLREFTLWLSQQSGYRTRIKPGYADYFRLSRRDEAKARAVPERPAVSGTVTARQDMFKRIDRP